MAQLTKSQKRLLLVLFAVLAYAIYDVSTNWDTYFGYYTGKTKKSVTQAEKAKAQSRSNTVQIKKIYDKSWKSDPFYVPEEKKPERRAPVRQKSRFDLKAISSDGENSVAMINDRIVTVGDFINGYKITKIESRRVVLGKGAQSLVLTLK